MLSEQVFGRLTYCCLNLWNSSCRASRAILSSYTLDPDTNVRGSYDVAPPRRTENLALALWLLDCALQANDAEQVSLRELGQLSYTFPLDLLPFVNDVRLSERFEVAHQGLDLEMVAASMGPKTT